MAAKDSRAAAGALLTAWTTGKLIDSRESYPSWVSTIEDVYAVHAALAAHPLCTQVGGLAGYKLGGIGLVEGQPCVYGPLFAKSIVEAPAGMSVRAANLKAFEAEVAFILGSDLAPLPDGTTRSEADVWAALSEVRLAVELVGTRHTLADATTFEKLADSVNAAGVVLGPRLHPTGSPAASSDGDHGQVSPADLAQCTATLRLGGQQVDTGKGTACPLGSPLSALTFCANHLNGRGIALRAGELVICGAIAKCTQVTASVEIVADFGELGAVTTILDP